MNKHVVYVFAVVGLFVVTPWACKSALADPDEWWNNDWLNRKLMIITENSGNTLTDYQIKIDLAYDADMQTDFDDLRFTSKDGADELSYWVETFIPSDSATVWVKVPSIPFLSTTIIYMYYGNPQAASLSDGEATFDFFDDFPGSSLDGTKWQSGCFGMLGIKGVSVSDSVLRFSGSGWGGSENGVSLCMNMIFTPSDCVAAETRFRFTGNSWGLGAGHWRQNQFVPTDADSGSQHRIPQRVTIWGENFYNSYWDFEYRDWDTTQENARLTTLSMNGPWYKSALIKKDATTFEGIIYDDDRTVNGSQEYVVPGFADSSLVWVTTAVYSYSCGARRYYYDWIFIRKYASPEPAAEPAIEATVDLKPQMLKLKSKSKFITCHIELPEEYDLDDIDVSTIMLNGQVPAESNPTEIQDYDEDGIADLMVKFNKSAVQQILEVGNEVEIIVAGELIDRTKFGGTDSIKVKD
jgi:hypothetical protein